MSRTAVVLTVPALAVSSLLAGSPQAFLAPQPPLATPSSSAPQPSAPAEAALPVEGPLVVARPFDPPASPYGPGHRGVDVTAAPGTPVRAVLPGVVAFAGVIAGDAWVTVDHGRGLVTTYGRLVQIAVRRGTRVAAGDVLGRLGAQAHLDLGARRDGRYIDPLRLLPLPRVRLVPHDPPENPPRGGLCRVGVGCG